MPDTIGNITVPDIAASGTFPIVPEYPYGRSNHPDVAIHQFGSGNAKIEQRFLLGAGARTFSVRRTWMNDTQRLALRNFYDARNGTHEPFYFCDPYETSPKFTYDPTGVAVTGRYTVRFNSDWSQSVTPGRSDVQIEIIELA